MLNAEERNTIQVGSECCTDEEELALINNGTCSTLIRTIDDHSDEESKLNPADVTNSIFLAAEDSMLPYCNRVCFSLHQAIHADSGLQPLTY